MTLRQNVSGSHVPYYMIDAGLNDEDEYEYEYVTDMLRLPASSTKKVTGAAERKKILTSPLKTDDCLKILVKYNNILNIKWQLQL
jgi:hypothetical protein